MAIFIFISLNVETYSSCSMWILILHIEYTCKYVSRCLNNRHHFLLVQVPSLTVKEKKPIATAEENTGVQSFVVIDDSATAMSADAVGLYGRLEAALKQQIKVMA